MTEYILIGAFMITAYFGFSYLRNRYLGKYKWRDILLKFLSLGVFLTLFLFNFNKEKKVFNSNFSITLIVLISGYFLYEIYKDIRVYQAAKKS
jgi:hypothetical protein